MRARGVRTKTCERRKHGHAVIEIALMGPWLLLMFLAVFNFGFFMYAGISVANAARAAALELAQSDGTRLDQTLACTIAKEEMRALPNSGSFPAACNLAPLVVTVTDVLPSGELQPARVRVAYETIQLFPLPWLAGKTTISRQVDILVYE